MHHSKNKRPMSEMGQTLPRHSAAGQEAIPPNPAALAGQGRGRDGPKNEPARAGARRSAEARETGSIIVLPQE